MKPITTSLLTTEAAVKSFPIVLDDFFDGGAVRGGIRKFSRSLAVFTGMGVSKSALFMELTFSITELESVEDNLSFHKII